MNDMADQQDATRNPDDQVDGASGGVDASTDAGAAGGAEAATTTDDDAGAADDELVVGAEDEVDADVDGDTVTGEDDVERPSAEDA